MVDYDKRIFARNLTKILEDNNMSQTELAKYLGVTKGSVSQWCLGEKMPRMDKVQKIAIKFNLSLSDLVEDKSNKSSIDLLKDMLPNLSEDVAKKGLEYIRFLIAQENK